MGKAGIGRLWVKSRGGVGAMILNFDDLKAHLGRVAMVDGAFDPVHSGHVAYFEAAALIGVPVLCNPASDRYVEGKHAPVLPQAERAKLIDSLKPITFVHPNSYDTETALKELKPKYYVKGEDWEGQFPEEQIRICKEQGTETWT
jgi:cytidyltransferase-like protein